MDGTNMTGSGINSSASEQDNEYLRYSSSSIPSQVALAPVYLEPPSDCDTDLEDEVMTDAPSRLSTNDMEEYYNTSNDEKSAREKDKEYAWEFLPGTDLTPARLGKPDPAKFFLCRQLISSPQVKDLCEYPKWHTFDWNDLKDITHLNHFRNQTKLSTVGDVPAPGLPWTQMERNVLKSLIERELKRGKSQQTLNWDIVARDLMSHFKTVVQPAGAIMAQSTRFTRDGVETVVSKYAPWLIGNRVGPIKRSAGAVEEQAMKYADIKMMLQQSASENKLRDKKKDHQFVEETSSKLVQINKPTKKFSAEPCSSPKIRESPPIEKNK